MSRSLITLGAFCVAFGLVLILLAVAGRRRGQRPERPPNPEPFVSMQVANGNMLVEAHFWRPVRGTPSLSDDVGNPYTLVLATAGGDYKFLARESTFPGRLSLDFQDIGGGGVTTVTFDTSRLTVMRW
jgi:hypothetical protein